jgi:hypothetical protein
MENEIDVKPCGGDAVFERARLQSGRKKARKTPGL